MLLCAVLLAAVGGLPDLEVNLAPEPGRLRLQVAVNQEPPEEWTEALAAGAPVSITYRIRLYRNRRWLWDQRLAGHELVVKAQRDTLTGVFALTAELDEEILAYGQASSVDEALQWMTNPPTAEIAIPLRHEPLWLVTRAEFLSSYKLLVIPYTVGTDWVQRAIPESP